MGILCHQFRADRVCERGRLAQTRSCLVTCDIICRACTPHFLQWIASAKLEGSWCLRRVSHKPGLLPVHHSVIQCPPTSVLLATKSINNPDCHVAFFQAPGVSCIKHLRALTDAVGDALETNVKTAGVTWPSVIFLQ